MGSDEASRQSSEDSVIDNRALKESRKLHLSPWQIHARVSYLQGSLARLHLATIHWLMDALEKAAVGGVQPNTIPLQDLEYTVDNVPLTLINSCS